MPQLFSSREKSFVKRTQSLLASLTCPWVHSILAFLISLQAFCLLLPCFLLWASLDFLSYFSGSNSNQDSQLGISDWLSKSGKLGFCYSHRRELYLLGSRRSAPCPSIDFSYTVSRLHSHRGHVCWWGDWCTTREAHTRFHLYQAFFLASC